MLALMRSKAGNYIAKSLMILLIVAFGVWGVGDIARGNFGTIVARVGSQQITLTELERETRLFARAAQAAGIRDIDPRLLRNQMLRRMIEEKLTQQLLADAGLRVGDDVLVRELRQAPSLLKLDGTFDPARFAHMLREREISEPAFLAQLRKDIENKTLVETINAKDIALPEVYRTAIARAASETRDVALVTLRKASVSAPEPDEAAIQSFYDTQKNTLYLTEETRTLEYATLSPAEIDGRIAKEKAGSDTTRDQVMQDITHAIEDALAAGKSLRDALAAAGLNSTPRVLTNVAAASGKDALTRAVTEEGYTLSEGETSSLRVAQGGMYYLVHVTAINVAAPKPLAAVRADILRRLKEDSARDAVMNKARTLTSALKEQKETSDWRSTLASEKLSSQALSGLTKEGKTNIIPRPLQEAIFEHGLNGVAGPMHLENGDAVFAIITGIHAGKATTLSAEAEKKLKADWEQEIFSQYFNVLAERYPITINEDVLLRAQQQGQGA